MEIRKMTDKELNSATCAIIAEVLLKLDIEEVIRDTMIDYGVHPFNDEVTETQVHTTFNEVYEEIMARLRDEI